MGLCQSKVFGTGDPETYASQNLLLPAHGTCFLTYDIVIALFLRYNYKTDLFK